MFILTKIGRILKSYFKILICFTSCLYSFLAVAQNISAADYYDARPGTIDSKGNFINGPSPPNQKKRVGNHLPDQQFSIALLYETRKDQQHDMKEAILWYQKSAEQNYALAQMSLARIYFEGIETPKDLTLAANWYERAANAGVLDAQFNLALMYALGEGRTQDYQAAASLYLKAAESGFAKAQYNLALLYAYGQGVAVDLTKAYMWLSIAENNENTKEQAKKNLVLLEPHMSAEQVLTAKNMVNVWQTKNVIQK